jgi:tetratricopeptide (TPR) repeat protein
VGLSRYAGRNLIKPDLSRSNSEHRLGCDSNRIHESRVHRTRHANINKLLLSSTVRNILDLNSQYTNRKEDVDEAIKVAEIAVNAAARIQVPRPVRDTVQAEANYDLGLLMVERRRLTHLQDIGEIAYAIECLEKAKTGVIDMARRVTCLDKLSELLCDLNRITGNRDAMQRSVEAAKEVLQCVADENTKFKPGYLYNCANKLRGLHQADIETGKGLLEQALPLVSKALQLLPEPKDMKKWTSYKTECAAIMLELYRTSGDLGELNKGIECCDEVSASSHNLYLSENYGEYWNVLAGSLRHRYDVWELKGDIERAIHAGNEAIASLPDGHREKGTRLCNLSHTYWRRFSRLGDENDLNTGIEKAEEAILAAPSNKNLRETHLTTLSGLLSDRYRVKKAEIKRIALLGLLPDRDEATKAAAEADINRSVSLAKAAAENTPRERIDYLVNRNNYARVLSLRANSDLAHPSLEDIDRAVEILRSVVVNTPSDELAKASRSNNLGILLVGRYRLTDSVDDVNEAIELFDKCSMHPNAPPSLQISAATQAANLHISRSDFKHANILLRRAVTRLRRLSPRSLQQKDQEHMIKRFAGLATLATSIALETGAGAEEAVQILEEGRGVILGLLFEVRSDLEGLR